MLELQAIPRARLLGALRSDRYQQCSSRLAQATLGSTAPTAFCVLGIATELHRQEYAPANVWDTSTEVEDLPMHGQLYDPYADQLPVWVANTLGLPAEVQDLYVQSEDLEHLA